MNYVVVGPWDGLYFVAYLIPNSPNVYQPVGEATSKEVAIAERDRLNEEARKADGKRKRRMKRRFDDWRDECKQNGEKPIPENDPVFTYAEDVGLPIEFVRLAWVEFSRVYSQPEAKTYISWRQHFQNAVRRNFFKLWFLKDDVWMLTTAGHQLDKELKAKQDREQRQ